MNMNLEMIRTVKNAQFIKYVLRFGIACTFLGHGMNALSIKQNWIPLLTVYGFSVEQSRMIMPLIGILDVIVALLVLIYPIRIVIRWAIFWTFLTALTRFIAGEGVWEFIERGANWTAPLSLLLLNALPAKEKVSNFNRKNLQKIARQKISINNFLSLFLLICTIPVCAQTNVNTTTIYFLQPVLTQTARNDQSILQLKEIHGVYDKERNFITLSNHCPRFTLQAA
jgi:hypothetical protein